MRLNKQKLARGLAAGLAVAGLVTIAACGGSGGRGSTGGMIPGPSGPVSLADIQDLIFTPTCATSGCHLGASAPFGLDLSDGLAFGNTVGVASAEIPAFQRINPGNAADSYLYMKVINDPRITGDRMPFVGPPLTADQVSWLESWINDGANP